jgi:hypothetical protein
MHEAWRPLTAGIDGTTDDADVEVGVVAKAESHERPGTHHRFGLSDFALHGGETPGLS